jgi:hypothetical protein
MNIVSQLKPIALSIALSASGLAFTATAQTNNSGYLTIVYRGGQTTIKRTDVLGNQTSETVAPTGVQESEDGGSASTNVSNSSSGDLNVPNTTSIQNFSSNLPDAPASGSGVAVRSEVTGTWMPLNVYLMTGGRGTFVYGPTPQAHRKSSASTDATTLPISISYSASLQINGQPVIGTYTAGDALPVSGALITLEDGSQVTFNGTVKFCEIEPIVDSTTGDMTGTRLTTFHITGTSSDGNGGEEEYDNVIDQTDFMGYSPDQISETCQVILMNPS